MVNINKLNNDVFNNLKKFIEVDNKNNNHNAQVRDCVIENKNPLVIFKNRSNVERYSSKDMYGIERTRYLSYEIIIRAKDDNINNVSSVKICDDLEQMVTYVMQYCYRMQGGTDAKIQKINGSSISQYTLHFSCEWLTNRNIIY